MGFVILIMGYDYNRVALEALTVRAANMRDQQKDQYLRIPITKFNNFRSSIQPLQGQ